MFRPIQVTALAVVLIAALFTASFAATAHADHETRAVIVNGVRLAPAEIVYAEQMTGYQLPSGSYWYDEATGYWGVMGGPAVGRVAGTGTYNQGSGVGQTYGNGASAYRNPNTGTGIITNPSGGGNWRDQVWVSPR